MKTLKDFLPSPIPSHPVLSQGIADTTSFSVVFQKYSMRVQAGTDMLILPFTFLHIW